jgi:hypothetical protein
MEIREGEQPILVVRWLPVHGRSHGLSQCVVKLHGILPSGDPTEIRFGYRSHQIGLQLGYIGTIPTDAKSVPRRKMSLIDQAVAQPPTPWTYEEFVRGEQVHEANLPTDKALPVTN